MSTVLAGVFAKAYILSTGTRATWGAVSATTGCHEGAAPSSLAELDLIRSADITHSDDQGDASSRKSPYKLGIPTQIVASVDLEIPWNPTDANFILLRNAKFLRKSVACVFLDQDKTVVGAQGLWADWMISDFNPSQPDDKEIMLKVKLIPTASAVPPEWISVTSGS